MAVTSLSRMPRRHTTLGPCPELSYLFGTTRPVLFIATPLHGTLLGGCSFARPLPTAPRLSSFGIVSGLRHSIRGVGEEFDLPVEAGYRALELCWVGFICLTMPRVARE